MKKYLKWPDDVLLLLAAAIALLLVCNNAEAVGADKQLHAGVSSLMAGTAVLYLEDKTDSPKTYAIAAALVPGILKELYDAQHPKSHTAEVGDIVADLIGATAGAFVGHGVYVYASSKNVEVGYKIKF